MPYDISIRKVALAGASGDLGTAVLKELLESQLFEITVITRGSSKHQFPAGVKVVAVDYSDDGSLAKALEGQDALVSAVGIHGILGQRILFEAAVKAGVKRIIPSEFGCDLKNANARKLPCFADKVEIEEYLEDLAVKGLTSYTLVYTGAFLDWGLRHGMFLNFQERKADILDGGDQKFSASRLSTAGKTVRRVLTHPRETSDRAIWVKDIDISQNELLKLAQALTPKEEWQLKHVDSAELEKECYQQIQDKKVTPNTMVGFIRRAIFSPEFGNKFDRVHNSTLGLKGMTDVDLEELVRSICGTGKSS